MCSFLKMGDGKMDVKKVIQLSYFVDAVVGIWFLFLFTSQFQVIKYFNRNCILSTFHTELDLLSFSNSIAEKSFSICFGWWIFRLLLLLLLYQLFQIKFPKGCWNADVKKNSRSQYQRQSVTVTKMRNKMLSCSSKKILRCMCCMCASVCKLSRSVKFLCGLMMHSNKKILQTLIAHHATAKERIK